MSKMPVKTLTCSSVEMCVNLRAILVNSGRQEDSSPVSSCNSQSTDITLNAETPQRNLTAVILSLFTCKLTVVSSTSNE